MFKNVSATLSSHLPAQPREGVTPPSAGDRRRGVGLPPHSSAAAAWGVYPSQRRCASNGEKIPNLQNWRIEKKNKLKFEELEIEEIEKLKNWKLKPVIWGIYSWFTTEYGTVSSIFNSSILQFINSSIFQCISIFQFFDSSIPPLLQNLYLRIPAHIFKIKKLKYVQNWKTEELKSCRNWRIYLFSELTNWKLTIEQSGCLSGGGFNFQFSIFNFWPDTWKLEIENWAAMHASQLAGMAGVLAGELAVVWV